MAYQRLLSVALGFAAVTAFAGQEPAIDLQYAAPDFASAATAGSVEAVEDTNVSVRFSNARLGTVLNWLEQKGVSFVVDESAIPGDKTVSLNMVNQPLGDVVEAIGSALGGKFEKKGDIYTFRRANLADSIVRYQGQLAPPRIEALPRSEAKIYSRGLEAPKRIEVEKLRRQNRDEFFKKFESKDFKPFDSETFVREFNRVFPKFEKDVQVVPSPEFRKELEMKLGPEFQKQFRDGTIRQFRVNPGKVYVAPTVPRVQGLPGQPFSVVPGRPDLPKVRSIYRVDESDFESLLKSLTSAQRDTLKSRGYLTPKDLTAKQRRYIGSSLKGKFEIKYTRDGDSITIKND